MEHLTRVLIADDRLRSRDGLRALLATWPNVKVVGEVADGREAVRLVEKRHPDVVLMDVRMPTMDGLEATRFIKDRPERLLTAVDDCWYRRHCRAIGCQPMVSLTSTRFRARGRKL